MEHQFRTRIQELKSQKETIKAIFSEPGADPVLFEEIFQEYLNAVEWLETNNEQLFEGVSDEALVMEVLNETQAGTTLKQAYYDKYQTGRATFAQYLELVLKTFRENGAQSIAPQGHSTSHNPSFQYNSRMFAAQQSQRMQTSTMRANVQVASPRQGGTHNFQHESSRIGMSIPPAGRIVASQVGGGLGGGHDEMDLIMQQIAQSDESEKMRLEALKALEQEQQRQVEDQKRNASQIRRVQEEEQRRQASAREASLLARQREESVIRQQQQAAEQSRLRLQEQDRPNSASRRSEMQSRPSSAMSLLEQKKAQLEQMLQKQRDEEQRKANDNFLQQRAKQQLETQMTDEKKRMEILSNTTTKRNRRQADTSVTTGGGNQLVTNSPIYNNSLDDSKPLSEVEYMQQFTSGQKAPKFDEPIAVRAGVMMEPIRSINIAAGPPKSINELAKEAELSIQERMQTIQKESKAASEELYQQESMTSQLQMDLRNTKETRLKLEMSKRRTEILLGDIKQQKVSVDEEIRTLQRQLNELESEFRTIKASKDSVDSHEVARLTALKSKFTEEGRSLDAENLAVKNNIENLRRLIRIDTKDAGASFQGMTAKIEETKFDNHNINLMRLRGMLNTENKQPVHEQSSSSFSRSLSSNTTRRGIVETTSIFQTNNTPREQPIAVMHGLPEKGVTGLSGQKYTSRFLR